MQDLNILRLGALVIVLASTGVFALVIINEWRLEARILIYNEINKLGKERLQLIEKTFAKKMVSMTINDHDVTFDDLDQIFLDYLGDNNFLPNFTEFLRTEISSHKDFRFCPNKLDILETKMNEWSKGDLTTRIPSRFFSAELRKMWKFRFLLLSRPNFFQKRALNFLIEVRNSLHELIANQSSGGRQKPA